jgi:CheY-like chemotaxis protein
MLPRVFDMFSRGSNDYEGTGIGLALVKKVTQRMGGRVGVESEASRGSRFWIELKPGAMRPGVRQKEAAPAPVGGTTLYVEDEEADAIFMRRAFARQGSESALRVVRDGREAIDYLSGAGDYRDRMKYPLPTIVLLDLNLPKVNGFEVLQWMRVHPDFACLPVVVFSSSTLEEDRVKAQRLGANEFVSKPSSGLGFAEVVEKLKVKWPSLMQRTDGASSKLT